MIKERKSRCFYIELYQEEELSLRTLENRLRLIESGIENARKVIGEEFSGLNGYDKPKVDIYVEDDCINIYVRADPILTETEKVQYRIDQIISTLNDKDRHTLLTTLANIYQERALAENKKQEDAIKKSIEKGLRVVKDWPEWKKQALRETLDGNQDG